MKNLMKKINIIVIVFAILVIASIAFVYAKRFYFAEFHHSLNVQLDGGSTETNVNFIKDLSLNSTISKVNTDTAEISFQKTTLQDVTNLMSDLTKDKNITYKFYEITPESTGAQEFLFIATNLGLIMFFFVLLQIYFFYKEIQQNVVRVFAKGTLIYVGISLSVLALQLGLIALLSRFYEIKMLDLNLFYITSLVINVGWISFLVMNKEQLLKTSMNLNLYKLEFALREYYKQLLGIYIITSVLLATIFGNEFVVYLVLLFMSLVFILMALYSISRIATHIHRFNLKSLRNPKVKKKIDTKVLKTDKPSVKRDDDAKASNKKKKKKSK